jgi:hypothetical protein
MPSSPIFCWLLLLPYLPVTRTCCGAIAKSLNEPTCQVAVYFPGDPTTGWRGDTFQLTIDNYGKTPAFVTHVNIGYWSLSGGPPPEPPPSTTRHVLSAVLPPGKEGLKMDVTLHRDEIKGDVIFGRFFYEDIFARRWWRKKKRVRSSGFILRIAEDRTTLAIAAPRTYTDWN